MLDCRFTSILPLRDFCLRAAGGACERCALACPKEAVSFTEAGVPHIDEERCSRCGICAGVCDAFSLAGCGPVQLLTVFQRIALQGQEVVLTCCEQVEHDADLASNVVVLLCLAQLPPELWAAALGQGIRLSLACDLERCETCCKTGGRGATFFGQAIEMAQAWTGEEVLVQDSLPRQQRLLDDVVLPDGTKRRKSLSEYARELGDVASGVYRLRTSEEHQQSVENDLQQKIYNDLHLSSAPAVNCFLGKGRMRRILLPRRQVLIDMVRKRPECAPFIPVRLSETDESRCIHGECLRCARACPTGARMPDAQTGMLRFDAWYCIGCGLCADACPEGAICLYDATAASFLPL